MTTPTNNTDDRAEILHISESDFRRLPRSVRMLILSYSKALPSAQTGLMILELRAYRWSEIDSEMKRRHNRNLPRRGILKKTIRYLNDYECPKEGAAWSRSGCASARKERCPVCGQKVKPLTVEKYVVLEWQRFKWNILSKLAARLRNPASDPPFRS
jgi:signal recognition particle subunit SEC65